MARVLNSIWLRVGLYTSLATIATLTSVIITIFVLQDLEYQAFYQSVPASTQRELDYLEEQDLLGSPRAREIFHQYDFDDYWTLTHWSYLLALGVCLMFGLGAGFGISRHISAPLRSIAQAARRLSEADFSVRATTSQRGGLSHVINDFNAMADALESLERERRITAAAISHELRTPLAILKANLHALADGVVPAEPATYAMMIDQVGHLSRLIDDVHTLSMADAGKLPLHRCTFDLAALAGDVVDQFAERCSGAGMVATLEGDAPALVYADRDRTRQVLVNLVENAIRYASQGKRLLIVVETTPDTAALTVKDWGEGMSATARDKVFERFYRIEASRTRATGGSGLGLAIVKSLVTAQGGTVALQSAPGQGCEVRLVLPASAAYTPQ